MPAPVWAEVASTSGKAAARLTSAALISVRRLSSSFGVTWSALVSTIWWLTAARPEGVEHLAVGFLQAMAGIDQHIDAGKVGAAAQVFVNEAGPGFHLGLRHGGIAVAGHVDEREIVLAGEENEFLGAAGSIRGSRQCLAAGERVDQA